MNRLYKHEDVVQMLVDVIEQAEQNNDIVIVDRPMGWGSIRDYAEEVVSDIPSAEKQGKWIMSDIQCKEDTDNGNYQYICSVCGHGDIHARTQEVSYCWWCGARMKGADDE